MSVIKKDYTADTISGAADQIIADIRRLLDGAEGFIITCAIKTSEHHRSVSGAYGTLTTGTISRLAKTGEKIALDILERHESDEFPTLETAAPGTIYH